MGAADEEAYGRGGQVPQTPQLRLTETIRNDVNLKKQTLRVKKAAADSNKYVLDFVFDANAECTVSIWYLAEEFVDSSNNTLSFESKYPIQPETVRTVARPRRCLDASATLSYPLLPSPTLS